MPLQLAPREHSRRGTIHRHPSARVGHPFMPGFTLVELLVVLGIVVVLIALLLPALVSARRHVAAAGCAANLRTIGQALTTYAMRDGYYPAAFTGLSPSDGSPWTSLSVGIWPTRLRAVMGGKTEANHRIFLCPARTESFEWPVDPPAWWPRATDVVVGFGYQVGEPLLVMDGWPGPPADWGWPITRFSYGYNGTGILKYEPGKPPPEAAALGSDVPVRRDPSGPGRAYRGPQEVKASRVRSPAQMIAIGDREESPAGSGGAAFLINPDTDSDLFPALDAKLATVHGGRANVLFCDGHVERQAPADVMYDKAAAAADPKDSRYQRAVRMWNASGKL